MPFQPRGGRPYSARFAVNNAGEALKAGDPAVAFDADPDVAAAQKVWPLPQSTVSVGLKVGEAAGVRMYQTLEDFKADGAAMVATSGFVEVAAGGNFSLPIEATQLWFRSIDAGNSATVDLFCILKG